MIDSIQEALENSLKDNKPADNAQENPPAPLVDKPAEPAKEQPSTIDLADFNEKYGKRFNREIKDENELQSLFQPKDKEYESKLTEVQSAHDLTKKEFDELKAKYESEKDNFKYVNLEKYFANPELYKTNQILLKYPDKDVSTMMKISNMDLDKANPVDLLIAQTRLDNGDIFDGKDDSYIKKVIADRFGDADLNDSSTWDEVTEAKIKLAAKEARKVLKEIQNVEMPTPIDVEKLKSDMISKENQLVEQSKNQWSPVVDKMKSNIFSTELSFKDENGEIFKYTPELTDDFNAEIEKFKDYVSYQKLPVNEQTLTAIRENITERWIGKNIEKILKSHAAKITTDLTDKFHNENHNDSPLSSKERRPDDNTDVNSKILSMFKN